MSLGSFGAEDKVKLTREALLLDSGAMYFESTNKSRRLEVLPMLGYLKYTDDDAEAKAVGLHKGMPQPVVGIPDLSEATRLGLRYLEAVWELTIFKLHAKSGSTNLELALGGQKKNLGLTPKASERSRRPRRSG